MTPGHACAASRLGTCPSRAARRGAGLVAAATVAGAWLARRRPGQRRIWFAAAAGALLIIAGLHLLPDAWAGARSAGIWSGLVPMAAAAAFAAAGLATRAGCRCQEHTEQASGAGTAAAEPVLLAVAACVLAQAARVSLRAAFRGLRPTRLLLSRPAATTMMAALVAVLAVHGLG